MKLNETVLGDLISGIDAISKFVASEDPEAGLADWLVRKFSRGNPYRGSLSRQANKLTMTFPVIMSNTITPHTATIISRAIERKCVVMLQMLFASDVIISFSGQGARDVIDRYYHGIDFKTLSIDDVVKIMELGAFDESFAMNDYIKALQESNIIGLNEPIYEDNIDDTPLSAYKFSGSGENRKASLDESMIVNEAIGDRFIKERRFNKPKFGDVEPHNFKNVKDYEKEIRHAQLVDMQRQNDFDNNISLANLNLSHAKQNLEVDKALAADMRAEERNKLEKKKNKETRRHNRYQEELDRLKNDREAERHTMDMYAAADQMGHSQLDFFKKQLLDSDVKKANELVPSMIVVQFYINPGGQITSMIKQSAIIGVKTRIVPIDSAEIIDKVANKNKARSNWISAMRVTTGESHFLKDFALAIDKAKIDAIANSRRGSMNPIWKVLERRARVQRLRKLLAQKNDASPITTLVITQEELDYMKKMHGTDLDKISTANALLDAFNLMGIVVVDESIECAKFLWDGELDAYELLSFNALEKEDSGSGGMYKKVINLLSQSR